LADKSRTTTSLGIHRYRPGSTCPLSLRPPFRRPCCSLTLFRGPLYRRDKSFPNPAARLFQPSTVDPLSRSMTSSVISRQGVMQTAADPIYQPSPMLNGTVIGNGPLMAEQSLKWSSDMESEQLQQILRTDSSSYIDLLLG
jgi:hypothetical protein